MARSALPGRASSYRNWSASIHIRDDDEEQLAYGYATVLRHHETIRNETAEGGRKSRFLNTNATDEGSSIGTHKKEQMQKRHASTEQEAIAEKKESHDRKKSNR